MPDNEAPEPDGNEGLEAATEPAKPGPAPEADIDQRVAELTEDLVRLHAEFENYKKRIERESSERTKLGAERVVADLLPLMDAFDKAVDDARRNGDASSLKKGLESLQRQLVQILKGQGLREIRTDGRFDPFEHEAMMRQEAEGAEDGCVLEVFQKGYALGPKVIRTAKVKVAKAPEPNITDHATQESDEDEDRTEQE